MVISACILEVLTMKFHKRIKYTSLPPKCCLPHTNLFEITAINFQSVTLGDEEANRRGVQKTVLERKGPSTFACAAEIVSKTELRVHRSLEATVDAILSGIYLFH